MSVLFILTVALIPLYQYRANYVEPYDLAYVQDHYHHSQWGIPNSPWGIGDDGFYQYAGNEVANGVDPYLINPEAPPLGKYLFGISIKIFNNPYFVILPAYFTTILAFYFLTFFFIPKNRWRILATIALFTSPIFSSQLSSTTLDLFQLCWLILHVLTLFILSSCKRNWQAILVTLIGGVTLGFFVGTKFGLLGPFLVLADAYLLFKLRKLKLLILMLATSAGVYLALYTNHFLLGGTVTSWFKGQKWIANYWLNNQPKGTPFLILITMLLGLWVNLDRVKEWTILWTLGTLSFFVNIYLFLRKKVNDRPTAYIAIFTAGFFAVFLMNFFWARYVLIVLPFLIIFLTRFLSQRSRLIIVLVVVLTFATTINSYSSVLRDTKSEITYAWENGFYKDLYNYLPQEFSKNYSRNEFDRISSQVDLDLALPKKHVSFTSDNNLVISYETSVGTIVNKQPVHFLRENGRWKIFWNWNYLLPEFTPGDRVKINPELYKEGPVFAADGTILSIWGRQPYLFVIPNKINDSNREVFLKNLAFATSGSKESLRILLYVRSRMDWKVPIDYLARELFEDPAIVVENRLIRTSQSPRCLEKLEAKGVKTGGTVILIDPAGKETVLLHNLLGC